MERRVTRRDLLKAAAVAGAFGASGVQGSASAQEPVPSAPAPASVPDPERIKQLLQGNQAVKWVFAGDSITHGARHLMGSRDYTELFSERVRWELGQERHLVIKTASSGWTLRNIADDLDWRAIQFSPQVFSIHVGMNDCKQGPDGLSAFQQLYIETVQRVRQKTSAAIILHTPNAILFALDQARAALPQYVSAIREVATKTNAILVDHYAAWEEYGKTSNIFYLLNDAIHPNSFGHTFMAHLLFRATGLWDDQCAMCRLFVPR